MKAPFRTTTSALARRIAQALFVWALVWSVVLAVPRVARVARAPAARPAVVVPTAPVQASKVIAPVVSPIADEPEDTLAPDSEFPEPDAPGDDLPASLPNLPSNEPETPTRSNDGEEVVEGESVVGLTRRSPTLPRVHIARRVVERERAARRFHARASSDALWLDLSLAGCRGVSAHLRC